jgi:hypothetical protein
LCGGGVLGKGWGFVFAALCAFQITIEVPTKLVFSPDSGKYPAGGGWRSRRRTEEYCQWRVQPDYGPAGFAPVFQKLL